MTTVAIASTAGLPKRAAWPRLHLVYFVLAILDLTAVAGGLYLSNRLSTLFEETMQADRRWDEHFAGVIELTERAADAAGPVSDAFQSRDIGAESDRFEQAHSGFQALSAIISANLAKSRGEGAKKAAAVLDNVRSEMRVSAIEGRAILAGLAAGAPGRADTLIGQFERRGRGIQTKLASAITTIHQSKTAQLETLFQRGSQMKRYEYLIGAFIVVMVLIIIAYGHHMGRMMRGKFLEIEKAHEKLHASHAESMANALQLETVNEDVTRLNTELLLNLRKLEEAQDEIIRRGKLSQLGQLIATVAHEIRNPLGAVRNAAYLVERKTQGKGLGVEPQLQRISSGITRCDSIITQLLDYARQSEANLESHGFDAWLQRIVEEEAAKLPAVVNIECIFGLEGGHVPFDPARMSRVLINLMANASEAMVGKGDDPAKFTRKNPVITIESRLTRRGVEVTVRDNGPGMAPDVLARVLEPLFTTKSFGTGLGLPAVEKIMQQHGGGLDVESLPGQGAAFTAWFPAAAAATRAA